jgi:pyrroloquinoline-quinone synthase
MTGSSPATTAPAVHAQAEAALAASGLWRNPYFEALRSGALELPAFRASQEQFYFAVVFFSRPMAGLIARLPDYAARMTILQNIVEEHGDFQLGAAHGATFERFLASLGSDLAAVRRRRPAPAVHAFNSVLFSACVNEEVEVGIACLGVIEHAFAALSARIGQDVVARGWIEPGRLQHYAVHAELDVRHADDFFALLEPHWSHAARRESIERGLALGAYAFDRLYRDLHALGQP